jgi:hypothetical protein
MAGGLFIDIITQPGIGPIRGGGRFGFYDSALEGRNPLIPRKGPSRNASYGLNFGGSLIKDRSSFSLSFNTSSGYTTPNLYAATLAGTRAESLNLRARSDDLRVSALLDYAITKDQTVRLSLNRYTSTYGNLGVGAFDLGERAYSTDGSGYSLRVQEAGPIGRRFFINTRFSLNWSDTTSRSATEAPTVVVNEAFTGGGAQVGGGSHTRTFSLASDLDYVRGIHSWRAGVQVDGIRYRTDAASNYLGTYTFASLAAYEAGRPTTFTRRLGDPAIAYWNVQGGAYVQDDIRVSKNLTLSPGVRAEAQTHLNDRSNIGPRFGVTWSPWKSGRTTLRGSFGVFYDWLSAGTYEQTLRVDGVHQQEMILLDPSYPDPGSGGAVPPTNRYLLGPDLRMARNVRLSAGIDRLVTKALRIGATYSDVRADGVLVGRNLNAPVNGVRADPALANLIETVADGSSRTRGLSVNLNLNLSGAGPTGPVMVMTVGGGAPGRGPWFDWKRGLMVMGSYYVGKAENNTQGAFSTPASGSLTTEWGPSANDIRHRVNVGFYSGAIKNFSASVNVNASSGTPYTIRTGLDDNGDLIFNDRPAGVGRNTLRMPWRWNSYGFFTYTFGFGKRRVPLPPGITITSTGSGLSVGTAAQQDAPRYRINLMLSVQNLTNHANYTGYSGLMTSPFFMRPTGVDGVRRVDLSMGFSF